MSRVKWKHGLYERTGDAMGKNRVRELDTWPRQRLRKRKAADMDVDFCRAIANIMGTLDGLEDIIYYAAIALGVDKADIAKLLGRDP